MSFRCTSTNLYLAFNIPAANKLSLEANKKNEGSSSTTFKIEKIINKINEYSGNEESSIWL